MFRAIELHALPFIKNKDVSDTRYIFSLTQSTFVSFKIYTSDIAEEVHGHSFAVLVYRITKR